MKIARHPRPVASPAITGTVWLGSAEDSLSGNTGMEVLIVVCGGVWNELVLLSD